MNFQIIFECENAWSGRAGARNRIRKERFSATKRLNRWVCHSAFLWHSCSSPALVGISHVKTRPSERRGARDSAGPRHPQRGGQGEVSVAFHCLGVLRMEVSAAMGAYPIRREYILEVRDEGGCRSNTGRSQLGNGGCRCGDKPRVGEEPSGRFRRRRRKI